MRGLKSFFAMAIIMILTGCGQKKSQELIDSDSTNEVQMSSLQMETELYHLVETELPDPDGAILRTEPDMISRFVYTEVCFGDSMFREIQIELEECSKHYLQILAPPYEKWVNYLCEDILPEGNLIKRCVLNNQLYFLVDYEGRIKLYTWNPGEPAVEIKEIQASQEVYNCLKDYQYTWYLDANYNTYLISAEKNIYIDNTYQELQYILAKFINCDIVWSKHFQKMCYANWDQITKFGYRSLSDNSEVFMTESTLTDGATYLAEEGMYYADEETVYIYPYDKSVPKKLCTFFRNNILVTEIMGITQTEDGSIYVWGKNGNQRMLSTLIEGSLPQESEKEVLSMVIPHYNTWLKNAVVSFNKQSLEYYIDAYILSNDYEKIQSEKLNIQAQITTGSGPDLIDSTIITVDDYARNGYLKELSECFDKNEEQCIPKKSWNEKEEIYEIPYAFSIHTLYTSRDIAGNKTSWNLEEMINAVEASNAKTLVYSFSALSNVLYMGFLDKGSRFIDYEKGISNIDNPLLFRLLEFAKKYADKSYEENYLKLVQKGEIALWNVQISNLKDLLILSAVYNDTGVAIGYPIEEGNGHYMNTSSISVNASTKCKEGAYAFISYLLSNEVQEKLIEDKIALGLPIRKESLQTAIKIAQEETGDSITYGYGGIMVKNRVLTQTEADAVMDLIDRCVPFSINDTLFQLIEDETKEYFNGTKTAEDSVSILNNRIQLYLNEKKD